MKRNSLRLLSAFAVLTIMHLLVYATVQQVYRNAANAPQEARADALLESFVDGRSPDRIFPADTLDLAATNQPFVLFYNSEGAPVRGSALLDGRLPRLPKGLLEEAARTGVHRVTWAPRTGIRIALVVKRVPAHPDLFIAAGCSLRYAESQMYRLWFMVLLSWIACCAVLAAYSVLVCRPPAPLKD